MLCSDDLNIAVYEVLNERNYEKKWDKHKIYHTKILALLLYETFNDFKKLLPNPIYKVVSNLGLSLEHVTRTRELHKSLIKLQREDFSYLKDIRNKIAAHKEDNAHTQIEIIERIDTMRVLNIANSLRSWITKLLELTITILIANHNKIIDDNDLSLNKLDIINL